MATSLAAQLSQIAAKSTNSLDLKAQRASHAQSLVFDPKVAVNQDFDTIYTLCAEGFRELCLLDQGFSPFAKTLFSEQSKAEDRTQMTTHANQELDHVLEAFLALVGARLLLKPAVKAVEWLVRRFRIHEQNTSFLLLTFLPYHTAPIFSTLLSILPPVVPANFKFLHPYIRSLTNPKRQAIVYNAIHKPAFAALLNNYVLKVCRARQNHHALLTFWAGVITEAVSGMMDQARSGRSAVQRQGEEDVLLRILPVLNEGLAMKKASDLRLGCYMISTVLATKAQLEEQVSLGLMEAIVGGWSKDTFRAGLTCLTIISQERETPSLSKALVNEIMKVENLIQGILALKTRYRIDKLVLGLVLGVAERLVRTRDVADMVFLEKVLMAQILGEAHTILAVKSVLAAAKACAERNDADATRIQLAEVMVRLSESTVLGESMRKAIEDGDDDIDDLELKLQTVIRPTRAAIAPPDEDQQMPDAPSTFDSLVTFKEAVATLPSRTVDELSFLSPTKSGLFQQLSSIFLLVAPSPTDVATFSNLPILRKGSALREPLFYSFFIRIWCGPYPVLARCAALTTVATHLLSADSVPVDLQAMLPYVMTALADPSEKVRSIVAEVVVALSQFNRLAADGPKPKRSLEIWGSDDLYRHGMITELKWMSYNATTRVLDDVFLQSIEDCILDSQCVGRLLDGALKGSQSTGNMSKTEVAPLKPSQRTALLSSLSSHILTTPLYTVKFRLLRMLNRVAKVSGTSRTKALLPILQKVATLDYSDLTEACEAEQVRLEDLEHQLVRVVTAKDPEGLEVLQNILKGKLAVNWMSLRGAAHERLRHFWASLHEESELAIAQCLMELAFDETADSQNEDSDAVQTLRSVSLSSKVLMAFLDQIQIPRDSPDKPSATKRRRTNRNEKVSHPAKDPPVRSTVLRKATFVLELIDASTPEQHPELLRGMFHTLQEIQRLKLQVGSELAYLHSLTLGSLLAIVEGYKTSPHVRIDRTAVRADVVIDCVRSTASPQVQNAALLLVASLAEIAPDVVLHSVMPIFTFMGATVLRQDDDYSVHVIDQTIQKVVPPLVGSLRRQDQDPVAGTAELLLSFVAAFEHVPPHRRLKLYVSLIRTLGEDDFLFALLAMLADKYDQDVKVQEFIAELAAQSSPETQLTTARKCLDLAVDVMNPRPKLSELLLSINHNDPKSLANVSRKLLGLMSQFLSAEKLVARIHRIGEQQSSVAERLNDDFSLLLQQLLDFADSVKPRWDVHMACGDLLEILLKLLPTADFIRAVDKLLGKSDDTLRCKSLKAFEARVQREKHNDTSARTATLAFLPRIATLIESSDSLLLTHSAISCVDTILVKYGKKDTDAATSMASIVAGRHALGHSDERIRVLALLCLASCVEVLGAGFIPVLPLALPLALNDLSLSVKAAEVKRKLHDAALSFIAALLTHVPWMITGSYLDTVLGLCQFSAQADVEEIAGESRLQLLRLVAQQIDMKECLAALDRGWSAAIDAGPMATKEYLDILRMSVERQPKSAIIKNARLSKDVLLKILDLRTTVGSSDTTTINAKDIRGLEHDTHEVAIQLILKMNDTTFRPIFTELVDRAASRPSKNDRRAQVMRLLDLFGFLLAFFDSLKSVVTSYGSYAIEPAVAILSNVGPRDQDSKLLWTVVVRTLTKAFEHDQDEFWASPAHFNVLAPVLLAQLTRASSLPVAEEVIPCITELAAAVDSGEHHKDINTAILKQMRAEEAHVRLAAVKCEEALTARLGEDWLARLPEMLPLISELQEDDDEEVERETHRWIVKMEGVLGESLDSMLQ